MAVDTLNVLPGIVAVNTSAAHSGVSMRGPTKAHTDYKTNVCRPVPGTGKPLLGLGCPVLTAFNGKTFDCFW